MSKKRTVKFMIGDEVTFINEFERQLFGFFFIDQIIVRKEKLYYQVCKIINGNKELVNGLFVEYDFRKVGHNDQPKSLHKLHKREKKLKRLSKKRKTKVFSKINKALVTAIVGYRFGKNGKTIIEKYSNFTDEEHLFEYLHKKYPTENIVKIFYQMIEYANKTEAEEIEQEYQNIFEGYNYE